MIKNIGIIGAGTMGCGIAQVASQNNHHVYLIDNNPDQLEKAAASLDKILSRLCEKRKISTKEKIEIQQRISFTTDFDKLSHCDLVIEAIIENLKIKHEVFRNIEKIVKESCILASKTSSLSIASIGSALKKPERVVGIHFFNPAPLMPLVEIIPAIQTNKQTLSEAQNLISNWGKTVTCKIV